ncbi:MAG: flavohemoglobin expression-modulating QEGLA motif protein [Lysobacteraceae bacterium]
MDLQLAHHLALDARLTEAVKGIRLLNLLSWPASEQQRFLAAWHRGQARPPQIIYPRLDLSDVRVELAAIITASDHDHPLGEYLYRNASSYDIAARLIEALGTAEVTQCSVDLFGRPGDPLPGSDLSNLDAARHFIELSEDLDPGLANVEADYVLSAEVMQEELQEAMDAFFVHHRVRVEIDPNLVAKAAAGATRIRLRSATGFTEYDRHQLLEHEAFVHSLTALNGREQPHLKSLGRTAPRITATQEGLATFAELITGAIDLQRLKRISLRIVAIDQALDGADFVDIFRLFLDAGQTEIESFASTMRVFRGAPTSGGSAFTKDAVYLHGLLSVHTFFRWALRHRRMSLTRLLFAGKMALHDVFTLEPLFNDGTIAEPLYLPPWLSRAKGLAGTLAFSLFANRIRLDRVVAEDLVLGV